MRILITVHQFLPDFSAGTEIIALGAARELIARGHEVQIFTGFPGPTVLQSDDSRLDHYLHQGIPVHRFTHAHVPMAGENNIALLEHDNPLAARFFGEILASFKPDIVHAYHLSRLSTSIIDVAAAANVPILFTATDFWFICPLSQMLLPGNRLCNGPDWNSGNCIQHLALEQKRSLFRRTLYQLPTVLPAAVAGLVKHGWFPPTPFNDLAIAMVNRPALVLHRLKKCAKIIAPSRIMRQTLIDRGIDADQIHRLPYGIDLDHIQRKTPKAPEKTLRVGFIGTLAPHKGPHVLVQAVANLPPDAPISLTLHGSADPASGYLDRLRKLAREDPRITFAGAFDNHQIGDVLDGMDVLVVPSLWLENTPRVIYEAHAAGCAVIASDLGGMSESIRPGEDGLLFPPGDSPSLTKILERLISNPSQASRLAESAIPPMSVREHVTQLEGLYQRLLPADKPIPAN
jgi:glycosyltransferase involved in cell wall biosynthesis